MPEVTATVLIHCPDRPGLVAAAAQFVHGNGGNVVHLEQHVDREESVFFMRLEWEMKGFQIDRSDIAAQFTQVAEPFSMHWTLHFSDQKNRIALFVSKESHCLYDLLSRHDSGELRAEIALVVSNHETLRFAAERFGIPFYHIPISAETKAQSEAQQSELLRKYRIDTIILARYMQILSPDFVRAYPNQIINIHHSFLPAFAGARPYHQAYGRGVKVIGATSHYVTADLDEGPIIHQGVSAVSHRDSVSDLIRHGKDLEKVVLAKAAWLHCQHKLLSYNNRTIVFT